MTLEFSEAGHTYRFKGQRLNSVTRILDHGGLRGGDFFGDKGTEYLDRGTLIHDLTAKHDAGEKVDRRKIPKRWRGHFEAWPKFRRETGFTPSLIEHRVHSLESLFAGTIDRVGDFNCDGGELAKVLGMSKYMELTSLQTILDIKNSKSSPPGDWVRYQLVGYGHALNPKRLYNRVAVALLTNGRYKVKVFSIESWHRDLEVFLRAAESLRKGQRFMDFAGAAPAKRRA